MGSGRRRRPIAELNINVMQCVLAGKCNGENQRARVSAWKRIQRREISPTQAPALAGDSARAAYETPSNKSIGRESLSRGNVGDVDGMAWRPRAEASSRALMRLQNINGKYQHISVRNQRFAVCEAVPRA